MHKSDTPSEKPISQHHLARPTRRQGFSLIEVTAAIAIIATAFIALLSLLPAGLQIFRTTVDATNTMRITAHLTSMLQAMEFSKLSDTATTYNIFYYDADGGFLDTDSAPIAVYEKSRVYAARIVVDKQNITVAAPEYYDLTKSAAKALVVVGKYNEPSVLFLRGLQTSANIAVLPASARYKVQPIVVAKTDGK